MERPRLTELLFLLVLALAPAAALAQAQEPTLVRLRDAVGDTIDAAERDSFRLFPNTAGFSRAVILAIPGPEFFAEVALAGTDTTTHVYYRIMPSQLERIRFLIDNREYMAGQVASDPNAEPALASFWKAIEDRPLRNIAGESADVASAGGPQSQPVTGENRYDYTLHGTTCGSIVGGCIGSWAGIEHVRSEDPTGCGPVFEIYRVDPWVFWGASCGLTALGTGAGYALGDRLDRKSAYGMTLPKEGTGWRTGCTIGALVPGLALGFSAFWVLGGSRYGRLTEFFSTIENDPDGMTTLPMALTGVCIAVEVTTIGYRIGRAIDRKNAEDAEARRRALGR